jgi:hypothetical protein
MQLWNFMMAFQLLPPLGCPVTKVWMAVMCFHVGGLTEPARECERWQGMKPQLMGILGITIALYESLPLPVSTCLKIFTFHYLFGIMTTFLKIPTELPRVEEV